MVKFGKHIEAFAAADNAANDFYLVPYNEIKAHISRHHRAGGDESHPPPPGEDGGDETNGDATTNGESAVFERLWRDSLQRASEDFGRATRQFWTRIFAGIADRGEPARGALPGAALGLYVQQARMTRQQRQPPVDSPGGEKLSEQQELGHGDGDDGDPQELLVRLKRMHQVAYHNTEALRKLCKKHDKHLAAAKNAKAPPPPLSPQLLPLLYAANFTVGQPNLEEGIQLLRQWLLPEEEDEEETSYFVSAAGGGYGYESDDDDDHHHHHEAMVLDRQAELDWLERLTQSMQPAELDRLVAHRGFHSIQDHSHLRPVENSLTAYEAAWTNGVRICECDIALTKDEKLVLAHDETFSRLALNKTKPSSSKKVQDLTFKELLALPLTSASRPPLLLDVLWSAEAIGDSAQLVIEIKPGNEAAAVALAQLLSQHPELLSCIAVIMSFDAYTINQLRLELQRTCVAAAVEQQDHSLTKSHSTAATMGHRHSRSRSISFSAGLDILSLSPAIGSTTTTSPLRSHFASSPAMMLPRKQLLLAPSGSSSAANLSAAATRSHRSTSNLRKPRSAIHNSSGADSPWMVGQSPNSSFCRDPATQQQTLLQPPLSPMVLGKRAIDHPPPPPPAVNNDTKQTIQMPKLMLLTVAHEPTIPCHLRVRVQDLSPVDAWMQSGGEDGAQSLDGVYLQYQPEMLQPEGAAALRQLSQKYAVGVWTYSGKDPDDYETFSKLAHDANVTFVNTDLPENFRASVRKKPSAGVAPRYRKSATMPF